MVYYNIKGDNVFKYEISFDREKLEQLQKECVFKSGRKVHKKSLVSEKNSIIKNFEFAKILKIDETGYIEDFYGDTPLFEITYIEYIKPTLYFIIEDILNNNPEGLINLYKMDLSKEFSYEKKISERLENVNKINDNNIDEKLACYKEIQQLMKEQEFNNDRIPIDNYYKKVIELINIKLVGNISINEIKNMEKFLGYHLNIKENSELTNILTLNKKIEI